MMIIVIIVVVLVVVVIISVAECWESSPVSVSLPGRLQPPEQPLSAAEWRSLKESAGNPQHFELQMMSAVFTSDLQLDVAK